MWTSTNFRTYQKQFDFTFIGEGKSFLTALKIDDIEFINMIEKLEGVFKEDQIFQSIICECGIYYCASGGWIALRQFEDPIFFTPAFERIDEAQNLIEYDPPYSLKQNGAFWLTKSEFDRFKKLVPAIDILKSINKLTKDELISLYLWDIPSKMYGDLPFFQTLRENHILNVSGLETNVAIDILDKKLIELDKAKNFELIKLKDNDRFVIISALNEDNIETEWKALCKTEDSYELLLGGTFIIKTK
jgi:hypothetical protein